MGIAAKFYLGGGVKNISTSIMPNNIHYILNDIIEYSKV